MKYSIIKTQKGIGLIEVLITAVIVAIGLLAVASLQGTFISSSGGNKTRAEAQMLAEQKLEQLRNNVKLSGYKDLDANGVADAATITAADDLTGSNAAFTRSWTIADVTPPFGGTPNLRKISVRVGWDGNGDGDRTDADEIVNLATEISWIDPVKAAQYASLSGSGGASAVASPRQNASEDAASENVIGTDMAIIDLVPATTGSAGVDATVGVTPPGGTTITIYQVAPGSHYYTATHSQLSSIALGVIAVFLCGDNNTCTHIQNHFGGVVHRIAGTVHTTSTNGFNNLKVAWTSSTVTACYNGPVTVVNGTGSDQYRYRPYECVYAGNCNATADGVNGCFADSVVSDDQINAKHVGPGGEYGDVGLLGVSDSQNNPEQVCFLEDTADPATSPLLTTNGSGVLNENYLYLVTKRFYAARRVKRNGSVNDQKTEGINHSFTNHDLLVIPRGTGTTANQQCNLAAAAKSIRLAPRDILRTLDEGVGNAVVASTEFVGAVGTAKTLTGTVTASSATDLKLIIPDIGSCYLNNASSTSNATAYACVVPFGTTGAVIKGVSDQYPAVSPAIFKSCTKTTDATACDWTANF